MSYTAALVVAGVLFWAGIAKRARPRSTAASFAALGLPAPGALARAVPLVELGVAAVLVVQPRFGAVAALVLLGSFTVVLGVAVRRGVGVGCACFGSARARPVSTVEVVRNVGLMGFATVAVAADGPAAPDVEAVVAVTTAFLVGLLALALVDLRREVGAVWANRLAGEVRQ